MITTLFTIGFTKKSAREFFTLLKSSGVRTLLDIRLNISSQLAGFAKKEDLPYFLSALCNCNYRHLPQFAPTKEILDGYRNKQITWMEYENRFNKLLQERKVEKMISLEELEHSCLLCAEPKADKCHRRLVAEYLQGFFPEIEIKHLY